MTGSHDMAKGRFGWLLIAVVAAMGLAWCAHRIEPRPASSDGVAAAAAATRRAPTLTLDEKRQALGAPPLQYFHGDPCTEDCSGHQAGYEWAERKDIADESDCDTPSESFNEGCRSFVEESNGPDGAPEDPE